MKAQALDDLVLANPDQVFYRMVFADAAVSAGDVAAVTAFVDGRADPPTS